MTEFIERVRVVATAAVTWLTGLAALIPFIVDQLHTVLPDNVYSNVAVAAVQLTSWIVVAVAIIRRVTPVPDEEHGILPTAIGRMRANARHQANEQGASDVAVVVLGLFGIVLVLILVGRL